MRRHKNISATFCQLRVIDLDSVGIAIAAVDFRNIRVEAATSVLCSGSWAGDEAGSIRELACLACMRTCYTTFSMSIFMSKETHRWKRVYQFEKHIKKMYFAFLNAGNYEGVTTLARAS
jgi:hypothetical protein